MKTSVPAGAPAVQTEINLECGQRLSPVTVAYETYGRRNSEGTNAILVCHALTASAHAAGEGGWWNGLIGPGKALDTDRYFIVCPNILGSCYGTTGPASIDPHTGRPYGPEFPGITIRDMVHVQKKLLDKLRVNSLVSVIGSSLGGMQVLEWAILYPDFCRSIIPISTAARQPAWCIGLNSAARAAIMADLDWKDGRYQSQPARGLALARMIGMISYRSAEEFEARFARKRAAAGLYEIESYLHYQGDKLVRRFDANTYICLTRATDGHDIARGRRGVRAVLASVRAKVLSIGVSSDLRYPASLQKELAQRVPDGQYAEIHSIHGHDAFLIEYEQLNCIVESFLDELDLPSGINAREVAI